MERINDNVVRMGTSIVNWYLVADDEGVTVVDAAFPAYGSQLGEGLRELGRSQGDIKAIALTHAHADHVGFAEQLRRKLDIPVYVHRGDAELAGNLRPFGSTAGSMAPYFRYPTCLRFIGEWITKGGARPHPIAEVTRFEDGDELAGSRAAARDSYARPHRRACGVRVGGRPDHRRRALHAQPVDRRSVVRRFCPAPSRCRSTRRSRRSTGSSTPARAWCCRGTATRSASRTTPSPTRSSAGRPREEKCPGERPAAPQSRRPPPRSSRETRGPRVPHSREPPFVCLSSVTS